MSVTEQQKRAIECAGRPLFIQAGAGTGKTFTLTKRLAWGLSQESGPVIDQVSNLLTITFTNKAAGELLSRVRSELRAQGLRDDALQIDAAWISTIHAMCQQILAAHALETGLDPGAALLSEEASAELLGSAIDETMKSAGENDVLAALLTNFATADAYGLIRRAAELVSMAPAGAESFDLGPSPAAPSKRHLEQLVLTLQSAEAELVALGARDDARCSDKLEQLEQQRAYLEEAFSSLDASRLSWVALDGIASKLSLVKGGNLKKVFRDPFNSALDAMLEFMAEAAVGSAFEYTQLLASLAGQVCARHRELKRIRGAVDTNDLLIETYRLLRDEPQIARAYCERFASVMVDEFQDTDALQVEIIERLTGSSLATLATVGDAQQSIYGFRGADLEVYRSMRAQMRQAGSEEVMLDVNFRSHPDILSFVEDIFSRPGFFEDEFLRVKPGPSNVRALDWAPQDMPRVQVLLSAGVVDEATKNKPLITDLRAADAIAVADAFESLHESGASYGDMAILMRTTKHAGIYLDELRRRGIPCVVSGGSTFFTLPEVRTLVMLLRVLTNRDDDEALFEVLTSSLFDLPDDDLLALSVVNRQQLKLPPNDLRTKPSLFDALEFQAKAVPQDPSDPLFHAHTVIASCLKRVGSEPTSRTLLNAVHASGWNDALRQGGAQGGAVAANIQQFCDLLDDYERSQGRSLAKCAIYFSEMLALAEAGKGARGKPGVLVTTGGEAVQVMTIHASKGLEFPIVAVTEYQRSVGRRPQNLCALTQNQQGYLFLPVKTSDDVGKFFDQLAQADLELDQATGPLSFAATARLLQAEREEQEEQRLLYVALTRAREVLLLVGHDKAYASTHKLEKGLFKDAMMAVFEDGLPEDGSRVRTPCGALVGMHMTPVERGEDVFGGDRSAGDGIEPCVHVLPEAPDPREPLSAAVPRVSLLHSYSSLHKRGAVSAPASSVAAVQLRNRSRGDSAATSFGTAFHAVAQWFSEHSQQDAALVQERIDAAAALYGLDNEGRARLVDAVENWQSSSRFAELLACEQRFAEQAFCVDVDGLALEGYIDLLCLRGSDAPALVIDYKTGVSGQGEDLRDRYELQAMCYAYAVLSSSAVPAVELVFVRPEAGLEEICFSFSAEQLDELASAILAA